jgi:hypothetical protein
LTLAETILTNATYLHEALRQAASLSDHGSPLLAWREFDTAGYNPTPTIIEAARAVYAGHSVAEIGRTDAEGEALERTAKRLRYWAIEARERKEHIVCLVSGTPGAGKSLLGLNLVLADGAGRVAGEPAVMLTGNRPLVQVLKGALIADARARGERPARVHRVAPRRLRRGPRPRGRRELGPSSARSSPARFRQSATAEQGSCHTYGT